MAFRCGEGVPGSGKSYYAAWWTATTLCVELKKGGYVLDPEKRVRLVTNIDGFRIPHDSFQTCVDVAGGIDNFFTKEYQAYFTLDWDIPLDEFLARVDEFGGIEQFCVAHKEHFSRAWKVVYLLDEAQQWFRRNIRLSNAVFEYFEWHRHLGHDIWFFTQSVSKINSEILCLAECIVHAQPRSNQIANEFTYVDRTFDGTELRTHRLVFNKKIAALYQSDQQGEVVKIKNHRMRKYFWALAFSAVLMFFGFKSTYRQWKHFMGGESPAKSSASAPAEAVSSSGKPVSHPSSSGSSSPSLSSVVSPDSKPVVEFYMYRLDWSISKKGVHFLLGISWIPIQDFPYPVVKKGRDYYARIPAVLLPALQNNDRALPIRTNSDKG